jgi:sporulation protein YlmC with PRC-barrel domain
VRARTRAARPFFGFIVRPQRGRDGRSPAREHRAALCIVCFNTSKERENVMATASGHTSAIRAKKVIGTSVKDTSGRKIGVIEDVVLDKQSNSIMFAVVGFGGLLGMAERYHPLPWSVLDYDERENAYVVPYTKEQLEAAPAGSIDELTREGGIGVRDRAYDYYKAPRYWEGNAIR